MRRTGRLAAVVAVTLVTLGLAAAPARGDGLYVSESFGGSQIGDELGEFGDDAFRIRIALGYRGPRWALEAWFGGDLAMDGGSSAIPEYGQPSPITYGLDLKRVFPVHSWLELYVRGSMSRMEIDDSPLAGYGGRGLGVGGGIQVKAKVPILSLVYPPYSLLCFLWERCRNFGPRATVAAFADQGYDFYRLHGPRPRVIDAQVTRWTLGFAIGAEF